jgi:hypothetical protein
MSAVGAFVIAAECYLGGGLSIFLLARSLGVPLFIPAQPFGRNLFTISVNFNRTLFLTE